MIAQISTFAPTWMPLSHLSNLHTHSTQTPINTSNLNHLFTISNSWTNPTLLLIRGIPKTLSDSSCLERGEEGNPTNFIFGVILHKPRKIDSHDPADEEEASFLFQLSPVQRVYQSRKPHVQFEKTNRELIFGKLSSSDSNDGFSSLVLNEALDEAVFKSGTKGDSLSAGDSLSMGDIEISVDRVEVWGGNS